MRRMMIVGLLLALAGCGPKLDGLQKGEADVAAEARDGDTLVLKSGLVVHLAEIGAPFAQPQGKAARDALERLAVQRPVQLAYGGDKRIRDAAIAHVWAKTEGGRWVWLEKALVLDGKAFVRPRKGNHARMKELLAAEDAARAAKRGIWADAAFAPKPASALSRSEEEIAADPACAEAVAAAAAYREARAKAEAESAAKPTPAEGAAASQDDAQTFRRGPRGEFALVDGAIQDVAVRERAVFLNFGSDYKRDFAVMISKDNADAWPGGAGALEALKGKTVRVRGLLRPCAKPLMRIDDPSEIELR